MSKIQFFQDFYERVRATRHWKTMAETVENSPWHREANVAVHTDMTINIYLDQFAANRTDRQQVITLMSLLFHDFGKPEAEEVVEKKDSPGEMYRRYAGHEPVSANEFMSFIIDNHELRDMFFRQGFGWEDVRKIKVMIEHHLPYGIERPAKRQALRNMVAKTFDGMDEECFYDMLRSDNRGRISDDHQTKITAVEAWIEEFRAMPVVFEDLAKRRLNGMGLKPFAVNRDGSFDHDRPLKQKTCIMLYGVSGAGKSTWVHEHCRGDYIVVNEDNWRLEYYERNLPVDGLGFWMSLTRQERYDFAWDACHKDENSTYDQFAREKYDAVLAQGKDIILDRMNEGRKVRGPWIEAAKKCGYTIKSVEFYISERMAKARQRTREDKRVQDNRVHAIYMRQETPWFGAEVDDFIIVA